MQLQYYKQVFRFSWYGKGYDQVPIQWRGNDFWTGRGRKYKI